MKALLVGGTGPTGPIIAHGLQSRGYDTAILHRGTHEIDEVASFEHLHADPHEVGSVRAALGARRFDLVVITYGRLRLLADELAARCERMVTVGGTAYAFPRWSAAADESAPRELGHRLVARIQETEDLLWTAASVHRTGLTHIRYPYLYGPRQLAPREWSIIRRIRDGRRSIPVLDGGLSLESRAYAPNAAHGVLLAVDQPETACGNVYHVADLVTPTDAQRAHAIAEVMGVEIELVNYPRETGRPADFWFAGRALQALDSTTPPTEHMVLDTSRIRRDLGYHDVAPFEDAIARTVEWYLDHPLEQGGDHEARLGDRFDYVAEDAYRSSLAEFHQSCSALGFVATRNRHAYDHPRSQPSTS